ncbi:hypothetical protein [Halocalculus aciditolerans]|uniref:Uncharacterized protein n=1 Tax=Halocalculus aciditolerans TaxID=1383812 RepID=A0A830FPI8_9EURY|nr:hypothetical protein [Halocalculus aciditolerans]GGL67717.1 hypothetical protein GCM10009039_27130 [Halocalculus aciditolerans]
MRNTQSGPVGERAEAEREHRERAGSRRGNYSCALVSFVVTVVVGVLAYPLLVALTRPFTVLATTMLVFALLGILAVTWLALDLLWDWRATHRPAR